MDLISVPIGKDIVAGASLVNGKVVVSLTIDAKPEVDALLAAVKAKMPVALQPLVDALQAFADMELSKA